MLRCVGLYHSNRGAHTFFLKKGELDRSGEAIINLIHYEDAAGLAQAVRSQQCVCPPCDVRTISCAARHEHAIGFSNLHQVCQTAVWVGADRLRSS